MSTGLLKHAKNSSFFHAGLYLKTTQPDFNVARQQVTRERRVVSSQNSVVRIIQKTEDKSIKNKHEVFAHRLGLTSVATISDPGHFDQ